MSSLNKFRIIQLTMVLKLQWCRPIIRCITKCAKQKYQPISMSKSFRNTTPEAYEILREALITFEHANTLGSQVQLTEKEQAANSIIMKEKTIEFNKGILQPGNLSHEQQIFKLLDKINSSFLFDILKKMPKGGILHAHDTALCSLKFLIELTYRKNLWICTTENGCKAVAFRFACEKPSLEPENDCSWEPMEQFRERRGEENVKQYLLERFSMNPVANLESNYAAWVNFMSIFGLLDGLLTYAPVWGDYFYNALEEMQADGVQYLEVRSVVPKLYCIDGSELQEMDTLAIYKSETERFMANNPDFLGAKIIYAPLRGVTTEACEEYVHNCIEFRKGFPSLLAGFDLVGQEELGRPLIDFIAPLLKLPVDINFYFHAGETNWYGTSIDENLIDAILLGTRRIGHGYALSKHPLAMKLAKDQDIAVEVCPISNQVLQLGKDYRNHPAAMLIANNVPIVISSDDPSFWRAAPLTHDFYFAFLGIAPFNADLRFLKQLVMNSLRYSGLSKQEKTVAFDKWQKLWDKWIEELVK